jgi:hypothetical protein
VLLKWQRDVLNQIQGVNMNQLEWIKELVEAEDQSIESGVINLDPSYNQKRILVQETLNFLALLKEKFTDAISMYNDLKSSPVGNIKIYTIAQTHGDFMLFRNGYKMLFSLLEPGSICIRFNFIGSQMLSTSQISESKLNSKILDDQLIIAKIKVFNELVWTYKDQEFKIDYLIKYYLNVFTRESLN